MKKPLLLFTFACLLLTGFLVSCHTNRHTVAHKSSKPQFIDGVYISPHNTSNTTANAIDHQKGPDKTKQNQKKQPEEQAEIQPQTKGPTVTYINLPQGRVNKVAEPGVVKKKYSEMLGVNPKEITNYSLYQFIDKWYGTDYRLGGCDKSGIDCSGFAQKLYGEVYGIDLLRTAMEQFSNCKRIKHAKDAEEGDLVFFHIGSKHITHVGVYLTNDFFVHASTSNGVMISNLNEDYWHKYFAGCGRVPRG